MKKILILDDDIETLNVVKLVLSHRRYKVKTVSKWETFLAALKEFLPDLLLIDIVLEGADGSEICKKLKQKKETKHIPVVLMSAYPPGEEYIKESKAQAFVSKPFEFPSLVEIVEQNLN